MTIQITTANSTRDHNRVIAFDKAKGKCHNDKKSNVQRFIHVGQPKFKPFKLRLWEPYPLKTANAASRNSTRNRLYSTYTLTLISITYLNPQPLQGILSCWCFKIIVLTCTQLKPCQLNFRTSEVTLIQDNYVREL